MKQNLKLVLNPSCFEQFDQQSAGMSFIKFDQGEFLNKIHKIYETDENVTLIDGYAPFCKHLFVPNFTDSISSFLKITDEN